MIGGLWAGIWTVYALVRELLKAPGWVQIPIVLLVILLLPLLIRRGRISRLTKKSSNEAAHPSATSDPSKRFEELLPDTRSLRRWHSALLAVANEWAHDVVIGTSELRIGMSSSGWRVYELTYGSKWKGLIASSQIGIADRFNEVRHKYSSSLISNTIQPFFLKYPKWRKAVLRAYESIRESLDEEAGVSIHQGYRLDREVLMIRFHYKVGNVPEITEFWFDGTVLTHLQAEENRECVVN